MIALVVFTDGRWHYLEQTVRSAAAQLSGPISTVVLVVDGGLRVTPSQWRPVSNAFPDAAFLLQAHRERLGFGGTIGAAWEALAAIECEYVFHLEDDFIFRRRVDLDAMAWILGEFPSLAQMALRRQPWNDAEKIAGGIVEQWPHEYIDWLHPDPALGVDHQWLTHRLFWTTNPSLYRRELCTLGWPPGDKSEPRFAHQLLTEGLPWDVDADAVRFGYWGARDSGEWVHHIGAQRVGDGY